MVDWDTFDVNKAKLIKCVDELHLYDICLGEGIYAQVFLGYQKDPNNLVAVKLLRKNPREQELIDRELAHLSSLNHPNIVSVLNIRQTASNIYIALELCKLGNLKTYLSKKPKSLDMLYKIAKSIFEGFKCLYFRNIIHRDIKFENILVDENET